MTRGRAILALAAVASSLACGSARETAASRAGCTACHGGADNRTGAPPWDLAGLADPGRPSVGAHTAHVEAGPLAGALACGECHPDPRLGSTIHMSGTVDVDFAALAAQGTSPRWDAATATCSATYCHGATLGGGTNKAPVWTRVGAGEAACGTCHGVPPPAPHAAVPGDAKTCGACHPGTVDAGTGEVVEGGLHLDGRVEAVAAHPDSWLDPADAGFHAYAADAGLAACQACHGQDLGGGFTGVACARCHDASLPPGVASWRTNCVMCHGGADNQTGAPPRATWGRGGDPVRVGAHTSHVAGGAIALALDCDACHVKPADALSPGHVDEPTATVTFAGLAVPPGGPAPAWDRPSATCSATYCHGATLQGGTNQTPAWTTVDGTQAACGTCHGIPPPTGLHPDHVAGGAYYANADCANCHAGIATGSAFRPPVTNGAITDPTLHVNGARNVIFGGSYRGFPVGGYPPGATLTWDPAARTCSNVSCHRLDSLGGVGPYSWGP